jgi:hypothetical protein
MSDWTSDELGNLDAPSELRISGRRRDGSLRPAVIIWMVTHGNELYVRSVNGSDAAWFKGVRLLDQGHISAGSVDRDVTFIRADDVDDVLDTAYRSKYGSMPGAVARITRAEARTTTLRVLPA